MNIFVAILIISDFVVLSFRFLILISPFHIKLQFGLNQTWLCPNYKPQRKSCQYESIKNPTELCINSTIVLLLYLLSQTGGIFYCLKFFWNLGVQKHLLIPNKWRVFEKWRQFCRQLTWTQNIFWNDDGTFAVTKNIYKNLSEMIQNSASLSANIMRGLFELFVNISESGCNFALSQCK